MPDDELILPEDEPTDVEQLSAWLREVQGLSANAALVFDAVRALELSEACRFLADLDRQVRALTELRTELAVELGPRMHDEIGDSIVAADGAVVQADRQAPRRTRWDNVQLVPALRTRLLPVVCTDSNGEQIGDPDTFLRTFDAVGNVVTISGSNAKLTGLRALGIDPDEYSEATPARWVAKITPTS